jgi:hypothetical protein
MSITTLEPSATITSTTEASSAFTQFVLRQIHCTKVRAQLVANQADMALAALSGGLISPEMAILILTECGIEVSS